MPTVFDSICQWTRKTTTSFAELRFVPSQREESPAAGDTLIYRLKHWPDLPSATKTAGVLLSVSGHLPAVGERIECGDWTFEVVDLDGRRIDKVLAARTPQTMQE